MSVDDHRGDRKEKRIKVQHTNTVCEKWKIIYSGSKHIKG